MRYLQTLLQLWCLVLICHTIGRRVLALGPPQLARVSLYLSPGLGLGCLVWLASIYGRMIPFNGLYSLLLIGGLVLLSWYFEPRRRELWQHSWYLCLFALVAALPVMSPEIRYAGYNPFTDIYTYLAQSQWLQFHAFSEQAIPSAHFPALTQISLYQSSGARMGGTFFLGLVQSLFHITWSYNVYLATVSAGLVVGCLFLGGIVRQVIPLKKTVILALSLLPCVSSNGFLFGAEWGFFPQTMGLTFALGLAAFMPTLLQTILNKTVCCWQLIRFAFPWVLCASAFLLAYNEPFPIFFGAIALFTVGVAVLHPKKIAVLSLMMLIILVEMSVLMNVETLRIAKNIYQTLTISHGVGSIGWPVLWSPWRFLSYSFGLSSYFDRQPGWITGISTVISFCVLAVTTYVLVVFAREKPTRRALLSLLICFEFVLLIFFIKFRYFSPSDAPIAVGHTFLQFKIVKYSSLFSLSLLAITMGIIWYYKRSQRDRLVALYVLILILGLGYHYKVVTKALHKNFLSSVRQERAAFDTLLKLRTTLQDIPKSEVIYLLFDQSQMKLKQMLTYIFWDRPILANYLDDGYILGHLPPQDRNRSLSEADWVVSIGQPDNTLDNGNTRFSAPFIIQKKPFHGVLLLGQQGGYNTEMDTNGHDFNWVSHAIDFKFKVYGDFQAIKFSCQVKVRGNQQETFHVKLKTMSGKILKSYTLDSIRDGATLASNWTRVNNQHKQFVLQVESDGTPVRLSQFDRRQAAFMISNVHIQITSTS